MNIFTLRAFIGFLISPGLPALALYLIQIIFIADWEAEWGAKTLMLFAYFSALVMGTPLYFFLQRKQVTSGWVYLILGASIGVACYALFFGSLALLNWSTYPDHALGLLKNSAGAALMAVVYGSVAGLIFWFIATPHKSQVTS
jgi:hypothetical protein